MTHELYGDYSQFIKTLYPIFTMADHKDHLEVPSGGHPLNRAASNESMSSVSSAGSGFVDKLGVDGRRSMDDERRELPPGWVRCFDQK